MRDAEAFAAGIEEVEVAFQFIGQSEADGVDQDIQLAVLFLDGGEERVDVGVVRYIALIRLGAGQLGDHAFGLQTQPLVLVGDEQVRPCFTQFLGNGPGDTALVGHAEDDGSAALQIDHSSAFLRVQEPADQSTKRQSNRQTCVITFVI